MGSESITPLIGYTTGLIVIALLLLIFLLARRQLPGFCGTCTYAKERPGFVGYERFCLQECMYNPPHRGSTGHSVYEKKETG